MIKYLLSKVSKTHLLEALLKQELKKEVEIVDTNTIGHPFRLAASKYTRHNGELCAFAYIGEDADLVLTIAISAKYPSDAGGTLAQAEFTYPTDKRNKRKGQ